MEIKQIHNPENKLIDIEVFFNEKNFALLGKAGKARELIILETYKNRDKEKVLPVLLGLGMGYAFKELFESTKKANTTICIVDKEEKIRHALEDNELKELLNDPRVYCIFDTQVQESLNLLTLWQNKNDHLPFFPIINPFYLRIDKAYYQSLYEHLTASLKFDFWAKVKQPRFKTSNPKILLISSKYFLMGEIVSACQRLNLEHRLLLLEEKETLKQDFVSALLQNIAEFQPDAVLTMNHLGVDREGVLTDILAKMELPLASWFVDNPHLVLHDYPKLNSDWLTIFTWDLDNIESLKALGFHKVFYLPLGTDPLRFHPNNKNKAVPTTWKSEVSFVGNSMRTKVAGRLKASKPGKELIKKYKEIGYEFTQVPQRSLKDFLETQYPALMPYYLNLKDDEARLAFETMLTWESTRVYRLSCVEKILPFQPLIVGDKGWVRCLNLKKANYSYLPALSYYDELPYFYTHSTINFNSTSMQMKGAVNQRIFDVPATGSFVITDWREQMDNLMESGKEIISYKDKEEIPELIKYYLKHDTERNKIIELGRIKVLAKHTWEERIKDILKVLKEIYGN